MDRIQQSLKLRYQPYFDQPHINTTFSIDSPVSAALSHDTTLALFAPLHYESGYAYPLLVWLHGLGSDERQLLRIMPKVSVRNYVAVAPRGPCLATAEQPDRESYGWRQSEDDIQQAQQRVFEGIDAARQRFHINPRRVFLAGFDAGGTMAFRVAMNHPRRFAGVVSVCGPFPHDRMPLANLADARQVPILLAVGRYSRQYPSASVCDDLRLFHAAGLSTVLREYPCGHRLARQMLTDVDRWIIEQITSTVESDRSQTRS